MGKLSAGLKRQRIASFVRTHRLDRGLSQQQLAYNLAISVSTLSRIEREKEDVDAFFVFELCDALEIPASQAVDEIWSGTLIPNSARGVSRLRKRYGARNIIYGGRGLWLRKVLPYREAKKRGLID